jgi:hypothetical protein
LGAGYGLHHLLDTSKTAIDKYALQYDQNGNPVQSPPSPITPALLGAGMGGGAAHFLFPAGVVKELRKDMSTLKTKLHNIPKGGVTAPTEELIDILRRLSYRKNAPRLAAGAGLGLVGGLAIHSLLNQ